MDNKEVITIIPGTDPILIGRGTIAATAGVGREWTMRGGEIM